MKIKFAERFNKLRREHSLTRRQLGKILNVSCMRIFLWEKNLCKPDIIMLIEIVKLFNTTANYIVGLED